MLQWETIIKLGQQDTHLVDKINQIYYSIGKQEKKEIAFKDYVFIKSYPHRQSKSELNKTIALPTALFVDEEDNIFVMDAKAKHIVEINANGEFSRTHIGKYLIDFKKEVSPKIIAPIVSKPLDFVFLGKGNYCISDFGDNKILFFENNKIKWIITNEQYHSLLGPYGLTVDENQNFYVTDIGNCKVHIYNREGQYLQSFGKRGYQREQFLLPTDICYDRGRLFVVDKGNNRVSVFNPYGDYLETIGAAFLKKTYVDCTL